jgi:glycine/D-amino acid oxidase-like deaminating enzyme
VSEPVGALILAEDEEEARTLVAHHERFAGLEPTLLDPEQTKAAEPLLAPGLWGCMLATGYPLRPLEATSAIAALAREAGAHFVVGGPAGVDSGSDWSAAVAAERLAAGDEVVVAAGWETPSVLAAVQRDRGQELALREDFVTGLWGVIVSVELPTRPLHPLIEGALASAHGGGEIVVQAPFTLLDSPSWLAVGSTMIEGDEPDGAEWTPRLLERGTRFVPSIAQAQVKETLVCARPKAFDNRPILGRVPGDERLWVATGHGGRGMSIGAASARLLADAVLAGDDSAIPAELSAARLRV